MTDTHRRALDSTAVLLMIATSAAWGFGHVAAKFAAPGMSIVLQTALRSAVGAGLVLLWAMHRRTDLWSRDGTLWPGLLLGTLFGAEFLFIALALVHTDAARMVVFLYVGPGLIALEMHFAFPQERLRPLQWLGILAAIAGIAVAFGDGFATGRGTLLGDALSVVAAVFWALLTLVIRKTRLSTANAAKPVLYQHGGAALILLVASWLMGEPGVVDFSPPVAIAFAYQCVVVAFASMLAWLWLLRRYLAARLSVLSSLTPLFGVLGGVLLLDEPITGAFLVASALVVAGIWLVNRRP